MKFSKNNIKLSTITLIILLTMSAIIIALPTATAQPGTTWGTWPIITATPDVVGVNQPVLIAYGLTRQTAWPQTGWKGLTITITAPDDSTQTLGPFNTDTTGLGGTIFTPTLVGTYTIQNHFPEQEIEVTTAGVEAGTTMLASDSAVINLVVTSTPVDYFPAAQQPSGYWTRPIDAQNREWEGLAGNWLNTATFRMSNRIADKNDGPETAHILWDKPYAEGGIVGGDFAMHSFATGDAYEGKWSNPIIVAGILISNRFTRGIDEVFAINVRTGEELWTKRLGDDSSFGQIIYWDTMNHHGAFSYFWSTQGSTWRAWDPLTGRNEYNMTGVPGGTTTYAPNGEILRYAISTNSGTISIWNSTAAFYQRQLILDADADNPAYPAGRWRPIGQEFDAGNGTQFEGTIPEGLLGSVLVVIPLQMAIGGNTQWAGGAPIQNPQFWAIDLRPGHEGELIFNEPWPIPQQGLHVSFTGSRPYSIEDNVFVVTAKETRKHYGLSLTTGKQLWETDHFEPYYNSFSNQYFDPWGQVIVAEGKLLTGGMGGAINAYDINNGQHLWEYIINDPYSENLFGNSWPAPNGFVTDGKLYVFHMEHSVINPMPRGAPTLCIDLATGQEVWRINGLRLGTRWGGQPIIGDSVIVGFGSYDNTLNALGKGPSETTVSAPATSIPLGTRALLTGTVMDTSPGTKDTNTLLRFPNGVPAVSDASMSEWMMYVYKTEQSPLDVTGVTVQLDVIDSNGNAVHAGQATTDAMGNYALSFEPEIEGQYMVVSSFEGTGGYYASHATTYLLVGPAPSLSTPIEPEGTAPFITTEIAIILAVVVAAVIGVASFWALKKRK